MRVTDTFGSSVGHHNLMQVVGAHTLEKHRNESNYTTW